MGTRAALATVARRRGSLPMATDAKMLVTDGGERLGTVGGGCVEAEVTEQALAALDRGQPALVRHTLNADIAGDLGLSCGGTVELFLEPVATGEPASRFYASVGIWVEARREAVVFTHMDWANGPCKMARAGTEELVVGAQTHDAPEVSGHVPYLDEESGTLVEPLRRDPRLLVFGAGHVGQEIARAAAGTDFHVVVVDDREEFANPGRLPHANEVVVADARTYIDELTIDQDDFIVVCTRGHAMDAVIVERVAASPAAYVGMLGSRRKKEVIWKALAVAGVPCDALERVRVPIGEAIGADTPAEIGISVLAELIRLRRLGSQSAQ